MASLPMARTTKLGVASWSWLVPGNAPSGKWTFQAACHSGKREARGQRWLIVLVPRGGARGRGLVERETERIPQGRPAIEPSGLGAAGNPYEWPQCTWYAWTRRPDLPNLGNAMNWATNAQVHGIPVGSTPVAGAIAVFQPNQDGAHGYGHVAYVESVAGSQMTISEMDWGYSEKEQQQVHIRTLPWAGVQFIYGGPAGNGPTFTSSAPLPPAEPEYPPGSPTVPGSPGPPSNGLVEDIPVAGNWTSTSSDTIGVDQPPTTQGASGTWYLRDTNTPGEADITVDGYGGYGEVPVVGDWTGDGKDTIGVYDPPSAPGESGTWFLRNSDTPGAPEITISYGGYGMIPVVGDWDGNGTDTIGAYLPPTAPGQSGKWFLRNSNTPDETSIPPFEYGGYGMIPVVGDWDSSGADTIGAYLPASSPGQSGTWFLRDSNTPGEASIPPFQYGGYGMIPVVGDWDGNGTDTVGAYLPPTVAGESGTWFLRNSNSPGETDIAPFPFGGAAP
jgi:surface antigen